MIASFLQQRYVRSVSWGVPPELGGTPMTEPALQLSLLVGMIAFGVIALGVAAFFLRPKNRGGL